MMCSMLTLSKVLRALAEGRIGWAFWPPDTPLQQVAAGGDGQQGLWIPRGDAIDEDTDHQSEGEDEDHEHDQSSESGEDEDTHEDDEEASDDGVDGTTVASAGRFGALAVNDGGNDSEDSDKE